MLSRLIVPAAFLLISSPALAETGLPRPAAGKPAVLQARLAPRQEDRQDQAVLTEATPAKEKENEAVAAPMQVPAAPKSAAPAETRPASRAKPSNLPAVDVPLPADPTYYAAKQLEVYPKPLRKVAPEYPEVAATAHLGGEVVLLLLIDETGAVVESSVVEANPPGHFEASALEAFSHARFSPARKNGRDVKSRVLIKVVYEINSNGAVKVK